LTSGCQPEVYDYAFCASMFSYVFLQFPLYLIMFANAMAECKERILCSTRLHNFITDVITSMQIWKEVFGPCVKKISTEEEAIDLSNNIM